jgi:hypothetical protein
MKLVKEDFYSPLLSLYVSAQGITISSIADKSRAIEFY